MPPEQDDDYRALCQAIGFVVINWALAEQSLDGWVAIAYHDHGGKDLWKSIPKPLSVKVQFLTQCFNELPSLASLKSDALGLLPRVTTLADRRNDLVHGAITSMTAVDGIYAFTKLDFEKQAIRATLLDFWAGIALGGKQGDNIYPYSSEWHEGGSVIERERIELRPLKDGQWLASLGDIAHHGDTALVAAMRCVVVKKFGEAVDLIEFRNL